MSDQSKAQGNLFQQAARDAFYAGLVVFGLFILLIGFRTDQNIKNELILIQRWGLLFSMVAAAMVIRFAMTAFVSPALAARRAAKAAQKPSEEVSWFRQNFYKLALAFLLIYPFLMLTVFGVNGSLKWIDNFGIQILIYVMLGWGLNIVVGLAGLLGSGRTELARLLFGADAADTGHLRVAGGAPKRFGSPREAIAAGIAFCSEDRKHEGCILELSVRENIVLALQARHGLRLVMTPAELEKMADDYIRRLGIKTASSATPIGQLSGGNQQKVLLARWLATQPALLILDEPTRGIDVRAKEELMDAVRGLAHAPESGEPMSVLFISSELPEVLHCSDRVLVMRDRHVLGEYPRGALDEAGVLGVIAADAPAVAAE